MQEKDVIALEIEPESSISNETQAYFDLCEEKLGLVPNALKAHAFSETKLRVFTEMYNELMLADSQLSKLQREMIAVVVSSENRCFYCLTAHGAAVRHLSGDPQLGEVLVMNYRGASLDPQDMAMLDFAHKLTREPENIVDADRQRLRDAGWSDRAIFDISNIASFFNMTNRVASATDMQPNLEYHSQAR
ncbi:MAG: peroxidase-related enzyme [Rhizobiaceae bacterium]|nr:peroxidase-related enzyme [Rhizobiaceae bacterium]